MKALARLLILALLAGGGCAQNYVIKLTNGRELTAINKPRLEGGSYYYKDPSGKPQRISQGRVSEIEPASMAAKEKAAFIPKKTKR